MENPDLIAEIQSMEAFENSEHERELLRILAVGEKELAGGEGHRLSSVLKEADALLRSGKPRKGS